ncbi:Kinesin-like protein NACK1 [Ananas comosus]|uniref:Kinesin-like protein n=1 Tax=Ananas comosus TaxID=4615 RepID=A0A199VZM9_ANACO|nr:Kinesin-like protein NACK1 [Ananas comosus]
MGRSRGGAARWEKAEGFEAAAGVEGGGGGGKTEKILVSVRLRPLSEKEVARGEPADWECINDTTIIFRSSLPERPLLPSAYSFDRVFRSDCTTKEVYEWGAKEVALSVVSASIFAYGQTSSGKTYTMTGITEYTVADIYEYIRRHEERAFVLKFAAMEIYNEVVKDLLSTDDTPLRLLDDPEKLTEETLRDWNHLKELISVCEAQRKVGETLLNENSSRSHQILRLTIESSAREFLGKDNSSALVASVNFIDLAGSERASQALSVGARLKEGCHINRSLLTLGTVIRKLSKGRNGHIPYRDSKLTRILQPSLGGNARTAIICTMSPARSHIEQSRNTLLFASCAKEVVTNAQVNVVMSDKALVKHLQRELARLESELRYPATSLNIEVLLKAKDGQIRKLEKEIKELMQQRDLAESRLEDLLRVVGDERASGRWEASSQTPGLFIPYACGDEHSTTRPSKVAAGRLNCPAYTEVLLHKSEKDISRNSIEGSEDFCKEVRCVEITEAGISECSNSLSTEVGSSLVGQSMNRENHRTKAKRQIDLKCLNMTPITLEQHLESVRKGLNNLIGATPEGSYQSSSMRDLSKSQGLTLQRSKSCRSILMTSPDWFQELEQNNCTPPTRCLKDFPGRPEGLQRRPLALNYDAESEVLSVEESLISEQSTSINNTKGSKNASEANFTTISEFATELKEMAQVQYQNLRDVGQNIDEGFGPEGSAKNIVLDPVLHPTQSPSRWPLEFERKQQEIVELWHACNVSLVHRTYFFLLFKGDPTDSIYMEVELRRLSFLISTHSRGSLDKTQAFGGSNTVLALSMKKLRHERVMLTRQMQKRLTPRERESIYTKWGISLHSKQRRLQLAQRLWTETKDLEHIRESASLVARLVGLLEPGKALKEMFGLSFTPQQSNRRSFIWKHGIDNSFLGQLNSKGIEINRRKRIRPKQVK